MTDDIIPFYLASYKLLADNTLRVSIDIQPMDSDKFFALFRERGDMGAIARLGDTAQPVDYGAYAKKLRQSSFFRTPEVWYAMGSDEDYQAWCRSMPCAICGSTDADFDTGEVHNEYAHVRRAPAAGTAYKPPFSGIPLCHSHHAMQHQMGEFETLVRAGRIVARSDPSAATDWFEREAIKHLQSWCWDTLKNRLGYTSFKHVPPSDVVMWAEDNHVAMYLPGDYVEYAQIEGR